MGRQGLRHALVGRHGVGLAAAGQAHLEGLVARGVSQSTAQQVFAQLAETQELFQPLQQGETAITQEEQIAGTFGTNAAAAQRIATRRRRRQAEFEAGGGLAETQQGVTGLRTVGQ